MNSLLNLEESVDRLMDSRGWNKKWDARLAYHVLECSEMVEASRGKHGYLDEECGDALITFIALLHASGVNIEIAIKNARKKLCTMMREAQ